MEESIILTHIFSEPFTSATPVECTQQLCNGICQIGNKNNGFTTYTFVVQSQHGPNPKWPRQECFTVYRPVSRENETLPIVFTAQCYARNTLKYNYANFKNPQDNYNKAARKYGFARILLSSPSGGWTRPSKLIEYFASQNLLFPI